MKVIPLILAGGAGKRMKSKFPKTLQKIIDKPMIYYIVNTLRESGVKDFIFVIGEKGREVLKDYLDSIKRDDENFYFTYQGKPLGTGDAVKVGLGAPLDGKFDYIMILYGDMPCIRQETVLNILKTFESGKVELLLVSAYLENPYGYGRIIRDEHGNFIDIVEQKDAEKDEKIVAIKEVNAGIYVGNIEVVKKYLTNLKNDNVQGEYYLTDIFKMAVKDGVSVEIFDRITNEEIIGVNDRIELNRAEEVIKSRILDMHRKNGVTIHGNSVFISPDVKIGRDTEIESNVHIYGNSIIGENVLIQTGSTIYSSAISDNCTILPYSVIEDSVVKDSVKIGPFSHLRPKTVLEKGVKIGNFVETKKAHIGEGTKANHLSYLGDCRIGKKVNVGAGTITCNYNGWEKFETVIEDEVLIGSDTQLVAPVVVRKRAVIGAGTTVVEDVGEGELAVSRHPQTNVQGYRDKKEMYYQGKNKK